MRRILTTLLSAVPVAVALAVDAWAADLTVGSFNALHLGWGKDDQTNKKCTQIKALMATPLDILLLQETMQPSVPCTGLDRNIYTVCSPMQGSTSYKEAYCAVYDSSKLAPIASLNASPASFSRPPYAIFMKHKGKNRYIWLANIHSVYGKTVGPRQDEATAAGTFFNTLMYTTTDVALPSDGFPVVFAGDWNLPVTNNAGTYNQGFSWVNPQTQTRGLPLACPSNLPTSLTTKGEPSSPYDHIILTSQTLKGEPNCFFTTKGLTGSQWRQEVSDHMAIYWGITFK